MEEEGFDELKAREVTELLLKKDVNIFRKLLPEIKNLNSQEFQNLFTGVSDYNYNVKNKKDFRKLCIKFDNFHTILDEWYEKSEYYEYLKEIWTKYPCIENLKSKDEKEFEDSLKSCGINYNNWPINIKSEFKTLVSSTDETLAFQLKKTVEDNFPELNSVLEELILFRDTMKVKEDENKIYSQNSENLIFNIIQTVAIPIAYYFGKKNIQIKEMKEACKLVSKKGYDNKTSKYISKRFVKLIEKKKCTGCYDYRDKYKKLHKIGLKCKNGKLNNLNLARKAKAFFKSKMVVGMHAALSFLNLGWSIYELTQTYKDFHQVEIYKVRLKEIVGLFEIHKKQIGILPDDFHEASERIKKVLDNIRKDQENLKQLMEDIRNSINKQNSQKNKAIFGLISSGVLGVFGVVGSIVTFNGVSLIYGISSCANVFSAIAHTSNIVMTNKIIDRYNEVLTQAIEEEKKMQGEIDFLIKELYDRLNQEPKFDLNASISSLSTKIDDLSF